MKNFNLTQFERKSLISKLFLQLDDFYENTRDLKVSPKPNRAKLKELIESINFEVSLQPEEAMSNIVQGLRQYDLHTSHPKYFGLFNPRTNFISILSDLITAYFNPQLAAWSHSPFSVQVETYLIKTFCEKFGYNKDKADGTFASGGAEANLTAILCALNNKFPEFETNGHLNTSKRPIIYCSKEAHHSIVKAARNVGLGSKSVKTVCSTDSLELDISNLIQLIEDDIIEGNSPLMVIGTAGTTGAGAIDPLEDISKICKLYDMWFHVDAAFGGGAIMNPEYRNWLKGIELSNSITFDIHKWLSVSMGTSMFLTNKPDILSKTFNISTEYMPKDGVIDEIKDPYTHSIQWSRRFIGLKLYLSLAVFGWEGYSQVIKHHIDMGAFLKGQLIQNGWKIYNDSKYPIICFSDPKHENNPEFAELIKTKVIESGEAWISSYPIKGINTLRACITNYSTTKEDIIEFVNYLAVLKKEYFEEKHLIAL
jgi:glutamate/tyrosine decarboxylase-like PLP-dependent enzyme